MIVDEMNKKSSKININFDFSSISGNTKPLLKVMVVNWVDNLCTNTSYIFCRHHHNKGRNKNKIYLNLQFLCIESVKLEMWHDYKMSFFSKNIRKNRNLKGIEISKKLSQNFLIFGFSWNCKRKKLKI